MLASLPQFRATQEHARLDVHRGNVETYGPFENCRDTNDIAYKLGRETEDAENKSQFLIYQNLKLMAHVYGWHGELERSVEEAEAAVAMSPTMWSCEPV